MRATCAHPVDNPGRRAPRGWLGSPAPAFAYPSSRTAPCPKKSTPRLGYTSHPPHPLAKNVMAISPNPTMTPLPDYQQAVMQEQQRQFAAQQNPLRQSDVAVGMGQIAATPADPWRHRSDGMRCRTCMWFAEKAPERLGDRHERGAIGRCRRHAPTMGGYPVVWSSDWCGDHRLDENRT